MGCAGAGSSPAGRCRDCEATHVLLPVALPARRADTAVGGGALVNRARGGLGQGGSRIAVGCRWRQCGLVASVRVPSGWGADGCRSHAGVVMVDPVIPDSVGGVRADTLVVIVAGFRGSRERLAAPGLGLWEWVTAVASGRLLARCRPWVSINMS